MQRLSHVFALMLATAAVAHAQPDKKAQALQLAGDSERAYKEGKFEKAAEILRKAHGIYPEPILLYNLGRALEGMGDTKGAIDAYEQYLHDAKQIDDRPAIERRVATLKAQLEKAEKDKADAAAKVQADKDQAEKDRLAKEQADKDQAEKDRLAKEQADKEARERAERERLDQERQQQQQPPQPPPDTEPDALHVYGPWATIGTGGALVVTGALFGWRANANHDDAVAAKSQLSASQLQDSAKTDASVANVMFVLGGAALIGGAVWEYLEWKDHRASTTGARIQIAPTGVAVTWTLR